MATTTKVNGDDRQSFITVNSPTLEAETSLTSEICGYCSLAKRPEKLLLGADLSNLCKCPNASDSSDPSIRLGTVPSSAFRRSPSPRPSLIPPADRSGGLLGQSSDGGKVEIVSIREKHGQFRKAIPHMPIAAAIVLCLMNVLLPGTGTLISAFTVFCGCTTEHEDRRQSLMYNLLAALLQLLLCPVVVGWIWSVLWGITFVNISAPTEVPTALCVVRERTGQNERSTEVNDQDLIIIFPENGSLDHFLETRDDLVSKAVDDTNVSAMV